MTERVRILENIAGDLDRLLRFDMSLRTFHDELILYEIRLAHMAIEVMSADVECISLFSRPGGGDALDSGHSDARAVSILENGLMPLLAVNAPEGRIMPRMGAMVKEPLAVAQGRPGITLSRVVDVTDTKIPGDILERDADEAWPLLRNRAARWRDVALYLSTLDGATASPENAPSPDFRSLLWEKKLYSFTPNQAAIIAILWSAYESGASEVGQGHLQEETQSSRRVKDIFDLEGEHKDLIVRGKTKGTFRLNG